MHPRYSSSCLLVVGISLFLLLGAECKPVQVRSVDSQQPARCTQTRPRSPRLPCTEGTKLRRFFFHGTNPKGCKRFGICSNDATGYDANIDDREDNYFLDFESCQRECMIYVQCPELVVSPQSNAYYSDNNLQGWGRKVVYECNNGYSLSQNTGKYERICQKNGTWSGQSPVCLEQCQAPPAISHANIAPAKNLHNQGSTVHYACDVGYTLQGKSSRVCGQQGEWVDPEPSCVCAVTLMNGKCPNCHEPSPMENGQVTAPNRSLNAIIRYRCDEKYILIGNSRRTCLQDGVWSGHEPVCWRVTIVMGGSDEREDVTNKTATVKMGAKNVVFQAITTAPNPFENIDFEWTFTGTNGMTALPHAVKNGQLLTFNTILRSKEQEGNYTILFGNFSASFTLDISDADAAEADLPIFKQPPTDTEATVGSSITLHCVASGQLVNLTWYHNNVTVTNGARHIITTIAAEMLAIGFLNIPRVETGDRGEYHCTAKTIAGSVSSARGQLSVGSLTKRFAEEGTAMASLCSQKSSADAVKLVGRVRKPARHLDLVERYKVHIKQVLRGSSKLERLERTNSIQTILLRDILDNREGRLKANTDYVFQGRLFGKTFLVSGDNVHRYTPSLQKHLVSC